MIHASEQNEFFKIFTTQLGPLKLWMWLAIVVLLFLLDRQGVIDVPLIGNKNGGQDRKFSKKTLYAD